MVAPGLSLTESQPMTDRDPHPQRARLGEPSVVPRALCGAARRSARSAEGPIAVRLQAAVIQSMRVSRCSSRARTPTSPATATSYAAPDRAIEQVADALRREMSPANNGFTDTWVLAPGPARCGLANLVLRPRRSHASSSRPPRTYRQAHRRRYADVVVRSARRWASTCSSPPCPSACSMPKILCVVDAARQLAARAVLRPPNSRCSPGTSASRAVTPSARDLVAGDTVTHADRAQAAEAHRSARCPLHPPSARRHMATATRPLLEEQLPQNGDHRRGRGSRPRHRLTAGRRRIRSSAWWMAR